MTCKRCHAHFCYRCGSSVSLAMVDVRHTSLPRFVWLTFWVQINPSDPYKHFNTPGRACYQKLFDVEELNRAERETAMAQAGIILDQWEFADEWREVRGFWEW